MENAPIDIVLVRINRLRAQATELLMEAQRLELGRKPQDLSPILKSPMVQPDVFWRRSINFDQTRNEQANIQSDTRL